MNFDQETMALAIVGVVAFTFIMKLFRSNVALPLAKWLLRKGKVGMAMKIKKQADSQSRCKGC